MNSNTYKEKQEQIPSLAKFTLKDLASCNFCIKVNCKFVCSLQDEILILRFENSCFRTKLPRNRVFLSEQIPIEMRIEMAFRIASFLIPRSGKGFVRKCIVLVFKSHTRLVNLIIVCSKNCDNKL